MEFKEIFGLIGALFAVFDCAPYLRDCINGKTKPHFFTWITWSISATVTFLAQSSNAAGAGAWVTAVVAIFCFAIAIIALRCGNRKFSRSDWCCLLVAVFAIGVWAQTHDGKLAVLLVTVADITAFIPTIIKSYHRPFEETASTYLIGAYEYVFALFALDSCSLTTALYPVTVATLNLGFIVMLEHRKRCYATQSIADVLVPVRA